MCDHCHQSMIRHFALQELLELGDKIGYVNTGLREDEITRNLRKVKHPSFSSFRFATEMERKCSICQVCPYLHFSKLDSMDLYASTLWFNLKTSLIYTVLCRKNLKQMKRWEGHTVAIATMCTASSSVSLRRTLAQFARLPLARIEIQTPGTLLVDLSGIGKFCCPVQPVIYIYYYCINTIHSLHLAERKWHVLVMFHQTTDPDTLLCLI